MKIVQEPTKQYNPYKDFIYECWNCGCKVELELNDCENVIKQTYENWYECNMPRDDNKEHYIKCPFCKERIPLFIAKRCDKYYQTREIVNIGIKKENNNGKF